jgi:carbonic anhydrase/acetyltransferase-like protein (isoleucine patch superfamily)
LEKNIAKPFVYGLCELIYRVGGANIAGMNFDERFERFFGRGPAIDPSAFVAPGAVVIGDVTLGEESSVWYNTVLRGDINEIKIGAHSNIQDGTVVHLADDYGAYVGEYVTVGHKALIHACKIDDEVLVGMGAIILDGAEIGARSIIGAGALVTKGKKIPPGSLVMGSPAKVVRALDETEQLAIKHWAEKYVEVAKKHRAAQT